MTVGEKIRDRRIELGMTQEELAFKLGYKSRSSVNKVELASDLTLKTIKMYADALGLDTAFLMGWEDEDRKYDYVDTDLIASIITSKSDMEFVKTYGKLNPENKSKVNDIAKALLFTQENH